MTYEQRKQERQALIDHLLAQDWNVFGTLKFVNGRTISRSSADKLLRSYWNRIDRMFFGKAAERQNKRVPRWCFAHEGSDSENFHVHFALHAPIPDVDHVSCVLNAVWAQHYNQTAPVFKNWIMPVTDRTAVASYLTREYWRLGSDTISDIYKAIGLKDASSHSGRRTYITRLANKGVGVRLLAALAGHSHISTTQRYIDVNSEQLSEAVELL
jgi:ribosomal protein L39E